MCSRDIEYVDVFKAVEAIKLDKGLAVLAHPGQLDSYYLIDKLVKAGLDGIEMNHEDHSIEDIDKIKNYYGKKYGLLLTGGSDYHGIYGETEIEVGDLDCSDQLVIEKLFA
jgi:predicted metal-dependent phosphoesterase TrpH